MPNGESPNQLIPREFAAVLIARAITDTRRRIEEYTVHGHDPGSYPHSRVVVFLEQTVVELKRAARHLETTDMADDPG